MTNGVDVGVSYRKRTIGALTVGALILVASPVAISPASPVVAALGFLFFCAIPLFFAAEKSRIPRRFDASGLTMRSGELYPWSEYRGLRPLNERVRHRARPVEIGVELLFEHGVALIKYRPITNLEDVMPIIEALRSGGHPDEALWPKLASLGV